MNKLNLNVLAKEIFEQNKAVGWWDNMDRCIFQTLQLVSTEIAEATEGERKNLMDDKLPHRKMGEVELADALIRILDLGGRYGWYFGEGATDHTQHLLDFAEGVAGMHMVATIKLAHLAESVYLAAIDNFEKDRHYLLSKHYTNFIWTLYAIAYEMGYDIEAVTLEKLEYNKHREDHKRENRAKEGGKQF